MTAPRGVAGSTWSVPAALVLVTAVGLVSALLGDGVWDALSWLALAAPLAIVLWCVSMRKASARRPGPARGYRA